MSSQSRVSRNLNSELKILGACWLIYGVIRVLLAVWLANFTPVATVMFGAMLVRVADPYSLMAAFHLFYLFLIILSMVCGAAGILTGIALLSDWPSARRIALLASILSLSEWPIGITLGVYTLIALLHHPMMESTRHRFDSVPSYASASR